MQSHSASKEEIERILKIAPLEEYKSDIDYKKLNLSALKSILNIDFDISAYDKNKPESSQESNAKVKKKFKDIVLLVHPDKLLDDEKDELHLKKAAHAFYIISYAKEKLYAYMNTESGLTLFGQAGATTTSSYDSGMFSTESDFMKGGVVSVIQQKLAGLAGKNKKPLGEADGETADLIKKQFADLKLTPEQKKKVEDLIELLFPISKVTASSIFAAKKTIDWAEESIFLSGLINIYPSLAEKLNRRVDDYLIKTIERFFENIEKTFSDIAQQMKMSASDFSAEFKGDFKKFLEQACSKVQTAKFKALINKLEEDPSFNGIMNEIVANNKKVFSSILSKLKQLSESNSELVQQSFGNFMIDFFFF